MPEGARAGRETHRGRAPVLSEHTRQAREIVGAGPLLVREQKVVLETDPARARQIGRQLVGLYLGLVNYRKNFLRLGFTDEDLAEGGSHRLADATISRDEPGL